MPVFSKIGFFSVLKRASSDLCVEMIIAFGSTGQQKKIPLSNQIDHFLYILMHWKLIWSKKYLPSQFFPPLYDPYECIYIIFFFWIHLCNFFINFVYVFRVADNKSESKTMLIQWHWKQIVYISKKGREIRFLGCWIQIRSQKWILT